MTTHTHKGECGQRSPPTQERNANGNKETERNEDVATRKT